MQWSKIPITDDNNLNVSSIAFGNGYYVALAFKSTSSTSNDMYICFTNDLNSGWTMKSLITESVAKISSPGIVFANNRFVIPFAESISDNAFSVLYFSSPNGTISRSNNVIYNSHKIAMRSVRAAGGKVIVCGTRLVDDEHHRAGCIWYCSDLAETWNTTDIILYSSADHFGDCQAAAFDTRRNKFKIYAVERRDNTNYHKIFTSDDLVSFGAAEEITSDQQSSPAQPAFAYCHANDALALFLHGKIYVSKAGQPFVSIPYSTGVDAESVNAATSDGTKFLASSASLNQENLSVLYSSGDPTVAANWHTQDISVGRQGSSDVIFADSSNQFLVIGGYSGVLNSTLYAAHFAASKFNLMLDRLPQIPNRFELTNDTGSYVFLKRADEPSEEGTKLSKATLLTDDAAVAVWNNTPPNLLCTPSAALHHLGNNSFHVGDILTTLRNLDRNPDWRKCSGGEVSETEFPELYPLLPTGSVSDNWNTQTIDNSTFTAGDHSYCGVATDGDWYVTVCYKLIKSTSRYDWYVFYTHDPAETWTKKELFTQSGFATGGLPTSIIYADGKFSFLATDPSNKQTYIVYASDPSGAWDQQIIGTSGVNYTKLKYVNNQYLVSGFQITGSTSKGYTHTFEHIGGTVNDHIIVNDISGIITLLDLDYADGRWYAIIQIVSGSTEETRLYHSETLDTVYSEGQYVPVATGSSTAQYFQPNALTCGNGYFVVWGYKQISSGTSGMLDIYYTNDLGTKFNNVYMPNFWGNQPYTHNPIFFDGTFYLGAPGFSDHKPYILYGASPENFTSKQLFASDVYRVALAVSEGTKTLFVGTQSNDYTILTAAWQKIGKSLPKLSPGSGLNAYIKVREGD